MSTADTPIKDHRQRYLSYALSAVEKGHYCLFVEYLKEVLLPRNRK